MLEALKYDLEGHVLWPKGNTMDNVIVLPKINDEPADLSRATDLRVFLHLACSKYKSMAVTNARIEGGVIRFTVRGEDQHHIGLYKLIVEYTVNESLRTFGAYPFVIAPIGNGGGGINTCPDIELPPLMLSMEISIASSSGGEGTFDHRELTLESRSAADQHPIEAITGLIDALDERVTETELDSKGYLTEIPAEYVTKTELQEKGYLTEIPSEYITETELDERGYLTAVPPEYITEDELTAKDYATAQSLTDLGERVDDVEAIAKGATAALVFDTEQQLNDWLDGTYQRPDGKTPADLVPGWHLLIKEHGVSDYWWDGAGVQILETAKVDLTDYYDKGEIDSRLANKVDKTTTAGQVYGTDENGAQTLYPLSELAGMGSLDAHADILSLDQPTFTMPDPENPGQTITKTFASVDQLSPPSPITRMDVTAMFTTNVPVSDFRAEMIDYGDGSKPQIILRGQDTSAADQSLVITAARGFGSWYDNTGENAFVMHGKVIITDNGDGTTSVSVPHFAVDITPENALDLTVITFPPTIGRFELFYWVGHNPDNNVSYWEDMSGVLNRFSIVNTSISNLGGSGSSMQINGVSVVKSNISKLVLANEYSSATNLPNGFLRACTSMHTLELPVFENISGISSNFLYGCRILRDFNFSHFPNLANISDVFLGQCGFEQLDISQIVNLRAIGTQLLYYTPSLRELQIGSLDFSNISVGANAFGGIPNESTRIIYADSQQLADNFKAKVPNASNWMVIINS